MNEECTGIKCGLCGKPNGTVEAHSCPYAEEINDDYTEGCNCCKECCTDCAMDI